ncbi:MAG: alpha/beta fold hydrolase, partial [Propionibacteriaceae bacterium]|nr:alpha/beta fold hydrolase [Propionibacteriaceae bacterium]
REGIRLADHVAALTDAVRCAPGQVVFVAHSGAGALASAACDQLAEMISHVVYVDSGPVADQAIARGDLDPSTVEVPLPTWAELEAGGASLAGLTPEQLQRFQDRAVPHPGGVLVEPVRLYNLARNQIPATIVCCSAPGAVVRAMAAEPGMFAPLADLTDVRYVDLPTGHWPMWSAPSALAEIIIAAARG